MLRVRKLGIDTSQETVAFLSRQFLFKKIGQSADKGEPLYRIHAAFEADFRFAARFAAEGDGYAIVGRA